MGKNIIKRLFSVVGLWALFILFACGKNDKSPYKTPTLSKQKFNHLLVATSDYQTGLLVGIDLLQSDKQSLELSIHSDAVVRAPETSPFFYVVNRLGADNIEWGNREQKRVLGQFSVGRGSNPQDIALLDPKTAYVSRLASKTLLKVNPENGQTLKEIDPFQFANPETVNSTDPDGFPEMTWMQISGEKLFLVLQRLDSEKGYIPSNKSQVAILNVTTDKVERIVDLKGKNPVTEIKEFKGGYSLGEAGQLGVLDGGIESFDSNFNSLGWVTTEKILGGDIIDCAILDSDFGVAIIAQDIYGSKPNTKLVAFRTSDGKVTAILKDPGIYSLQQIIRDDSRSVFYLSDRNPRKPGVWVYDSKTLLPILDGYYPTRLPPYHMVLSY